MHLKFRMATTHFWPSYSGHLSTRAFGPFTKKKFYQLPSNALLNCHFSNCQLLFLNHPFLLNHSPQLSPVLLKCHSLNYFLHSSPLTVFHHCSQLSLSQLFLHSFLLNWHCFICSFSTPLSLGVLLICFQLLFLHSSLNWHCLNCFLHSCSPSLFSTVSLSTTFPHSWLLNWYWLICFLHSSLNWHCLDFFLHSSLLSCFLSLSLQLLSLQLSMSMSQLLCNCIFSAAPLTATVIDNVNLWRLQC